MKCINRQFGKLCCIVGLVLFLTACKNEEDIVASYEVENYSTNLYKESLYSENICVSSQDVAIEGFTNDSELYASALFDLNNINVAYANNIHDKIFPASTTKILTALIALEECSIDEIVTISKSAAASSFAFDEQVCGLKEGDQISIEALLYGLLLHSGNDNAVAIAEYVGGSVEKFAELMNKKAAELFATNTNFVTPNGLHNENHYTTAYDLYLIFNECIKYDDFVKMISSNQYTADIIDINGTLRQVTWESTSFYARGLANKPTGATVIGGKTGYTGEAGNCLILLNVDETGNRYVSIVMGAKDKPVLYDDMTAILDQIPNL